MVNECWLVHKNRHITICMFNVCKFDSKEVVNFSSEITWSFFFEFCFKIFFYFCAGGEVDEIIYIKAKIKRRVNWYDGTMKDTRGMRKLSETNLF